MEIPLRSECVLTGKLNEKPNFDCTRMCSKKVMNLRAT